jgi:hypothetical protein
MTFTTDVRRTYFALRMWIGGIGLAVPVFLVGWGLWGCKVQWCDMGSLSASYWARIPGGDVTPLRDWFVGALCAIGIGLVMYKGYRVLEDWLLNLAGTALVVVAMNPMAKPPGTGIGVHEIAACIFFLLIAISVWKCADSTLSLAPEEARPRWRWIYLGLAIGMFPGVPRAYFVAGKGHQILFAEWFGVWTFATYWFAKTWELAYVSRVEPLGEQPPQLAWLNGALSRVD